MKGLKYLGERWGSNPRPSEPQSDALPTELLPPYFKITKLTFFSYLSTIYTKIFILFFVFSLFGCSSIVRFGQVEQSKTSENPQNNETKYLRGLASYYSDEFHGRVTASGEIYNREDYTAAHRTLPFGTYVRVINMKNKLTVIVRINDRGPFVEGRIIDLSYAAAQKLDMIRDGVVPVVIEIMD